MSSRCAYLLGGTLLLLLFQIGAHPPLNFKQPQPKSGLCVAKWLAPSFLRRLCFEWCGNLPDIYIYIYIYLYIYIICIHCSLRSLTVWFWFEIERVVQSCYTGGRGPPCSSRLCPTASSWHGELLECAQIWLVKGMSKWMVLGMSCVLASFLFYFLRCGPQPLCSQFFSATLATLFPAILLSATLGALLSATLLSATLAGLFSVSLSYANYTLL